MDAGFDGGEEFDSEVDGDLDDAGEVDGHVVEPGCSGESPDEPQHVGGCCNGPDDCVSGWCFSGFCTKQCTSDGDCSTTSLGPFPEGTEFGCNTNLFGYVGICAPGSLELCGGEGDQPCPSGESCAFGWDSEVTVSNDPDQPAIRGRCLTNLYGEGLLKGGEQCDSHSDVFHYQCETPGFIVQSCVDRRCAPVCDVNNPEDTCPDGLQCVGLLAWDWGAANPVLVTGICQGQTCGFLEFTGDHENDVRLPGADAYCPDGEICRGFWTTGEDGSTLVQTCIPSVEGYGAPGEECEQSPKYEKFCNHEWCWQDMPEWSSGGAVCKDDWDCEFDEVCANPPNQFLSARCAPKPEPGFCSPFCRTDADCPDMLGTPSVCIAVGAGKLPNGEDAHIGGCLPLEVAFDGEDFVVCEKESDCDNALGQGCFFVGGYSEFMYCWQGVEVDPDGTVCTDDPDVCGEGEVCAEDRDTGISHCTEALFVGDPCDPATDQCLSFDGQACMDGDFSTEDEHGNPTNTFCSALCTKTDDCGPNQVCENVVVAELDPETRDDDIILGVCRAMTVVVPGDECMDNDACAGDKLCDLQTGRCYNPDAAWGAVCDDDSDCNHNGLCNTDVANGMCYKPGCDPSDPGDYCDDGGGAVCSAERKVGICLEECTDDGDCSRNGSDGHVCVNGACWNP